MSVQKARKVALAYWGFSKKATARARSGVDVDIVKGNGGSGLESATAPEKRFAVMVEGLWEDYMGQVGGYGRIPFEVLLDVAKKVKSSGDVEGKSDMGEVQKWVKMLINENSNYFIARAENKKQVMELLINTKR
ncbi:MAG: hypothetical protein VYE50_01480 [Candidatus Thermoplasmatota archaeon]|nr:hypothetical protein [Candidatus Thermoplasmatota archaeon]MEC9333258.1 hypothetical protein [Candidatus Thermoplasmatota archaeon]MED6305981.1 hypothetical protein [Candidatus Thermoplasmatota archaeon]